MANPNNPFGFKWTRNMSGGAPTCQLQTAWIASNYTTAIFRGDVVTFNAGYIQIGTTGTPAIFGIFDGCEYQSVSLKQPRWSPYWPGSDNNGVIKCYIITDPFAVFQVQTDGTTAVGQAAVDQASQFVVGTGSPAGNTATGQSNQSLSHSYTTTSTLPFRIVNVGGPGNQWLGTDNTSPYNIVEVIFQNQWTRAGVTAI